MRGAPLAVLLAGCLAQARAIEPVRVLPERAVAAGSALRLEVLVTNPNRTPAVLQAVDWTLRVDDAPLVRGRLDEDETIAPLGQRTLTLSLPGRDPFPSGAVRLEGLFHFRGDLAAPFTVDVEVGVTR